MARKLTQVIKLQIEAGKATPAPPIGTVLGPAGINIGEFCSQFNATSQERKGEIVPVALSVYDDRTFDFVLKSAPTSYLLKKAAGIDKGSGKNVTRKAGTVSIAQIREIAEKKKNDLNARTIDAAMQIVTGTAKSMGITVKG